MTSRRSTNCCGPFTHNYGITVSAAVRVHPPSDTVISAVAFVEVVRVEIAKVARDDPAGTFTSGGTLANDGFALEIFKTPPSLFVARANTTEPTTADPPITF